MPVRILHFTIRDFLLQSNSTFRVDEKETHKKIVIQCLSIMRRSLTKNICTLPSSGTHRMGIDSQAIGQCLSADLQCSCRYWAYHLGQSKDPVTEMDWCFFISPGAFSPLYGINEYLGIVSEAVGIINILQSIIRVSFLCKESPMRSSRMNNIGWDRFWSISVSTWCETVCS
jgi:hypothetical protein